jgi:hypothetical protein
MQTTRLAMVLAIAAASTPGVADVYAEQDGDEVSANAEADARLESYKRNELALYDALSTDPSPRIQVLAGRMAIEDDETPTVLRPKSADVVARAAGFAPDDAFVQWVAASEGSYASSSCGPTHWPEAEVANLLRLEPDNAAAWQFGVGLALAKGDQAGIDDALSRMAVASRADDHVTDELAAWTSAFEAHPEITRSATSFWEDAEPTPKQGALIEGLQRVRHYYSSGAWALESVCKPDAASDRTWQRLGWCADAAKVLAEKGASLDLRKQGLDLLAAIGERSDASAPAQRQYDWLDANRANPLVKYEGVPESPDLVLADWQGATSEIAAIERHLRHLGLPMTPPESWIKPVSAEEASDALDEEENRKTAQEYAEYLSALFEDMRTSPQAEQRVFASLRADLLTEVKKFAGDTEAKPADTIASGDDPIAALAEANAGNLKVQWMIAGTADKRIPAETIAAAIARVQQAEGDNAAAWTLSLPDRADDTSAATVDATLARIATSTHYDTHAMDTMSIMLEAMRNRPLPDELVAAWGRKSGNAMSADYAAKVMALAMTYASTPAPNGLVTACGISKGGTIEQARRDACIASGRLLVHKATTVIGLNFGEAVLRRLNALDQTDADRARHVWWWHSVSTSAERTGEEPPNLDDFIATGNEIEALRLNAEQLGKVDPPANWKSRNERALRK